MDQSLRWMNPSLFCPCSSFPLRSISFAFLSKHLNFDQMLGQALVKSCAQIMQISQLRPWGLNHEQDQKWPSSRHRAQKNPWTRHGSNPPVEYRLNQPMSRIILWTTALWISVARLICFFIPRSPVWNSSCLTRWRNYLKTPVGLKFGCPYWPIHPGSWWPSFQSLFRIFPALRSAILRKSTPW